MLLQLRRRGLHRRCCYLSLVREATNVNEAQLLLILMAECVQEVGPRATLRHSFNVCQRVVGYIVQFHSVLKLMMLSGREARRLPRRDQSRATILTWVETKVCPRSCQISSPCYNDPMTQDSKHAIRPRCRPNTAP